MSEPAKDWRIGLRAKPKMRSHELRYETAEIVDVHPPGTGGIHDKDGVLRLRLSSGACIIVPADEWMTA